MKLHIRRSMALATVLGCVFLLVRPSMAAPPQQTGPATAKSHSTHPAKARHGKAPGHPAWASKHVSAERKTGTPHHVHRGHLVHRDLAHRNLRKAGKAGSGKNSAGNEKDGSR